MIVSGFGEQSAALAGRVGDGYFGTAPKHELLDTFAASGGRGPRYAELTICWADDADTARKRVHEIWPNARLSGQLSQDLPTWTHFEQAIEPLTIDQVTAQTPCEPDIADELCDVIAQYEAAGYDHIYLHQVGPDQDGFFRFCERELGPALARVINLLGGPRTEEEAGAVIDDRDREEHAAPGRGAVPRPRLQLARGEPTYSLNFVPGSSVDCPAFAPLVTAHWNAVTGSPFFTILAAAPVEDLTLPVIFTRVS